MSRLIRLLLTAGAVAMTGIAVKMIREKKQEEELRDHDEDEFHFVELDDVKSDGPEVEEISALYPYLSKEFIAAELKKNETYNRQFPTDTLVHVTYIIAFADGDKRDVFVQAVAEKGYDVCVLEDGKVQVSRQFFTEDGAVLSDIYNVANQAACLDGQWLDCTVSR